MAMYIVLGRFSEQGIRAVKDTTKRAVAARELAKKMGATMKDVYWGPSASMTWWRWSRPRMTRPSQPSA